MVVPLLSVSGSWFAAAEYVLPDNVTPETVQRTLAVFLAMPAFDTVHWPFASVVQLALPVAPLLHEPLTTAPATGPCEAVCTLMTTDAVQVFPVPPPVPSRSPT
jgi:hypothetical protein